MTLAEAIAVELEVSALGYPLPYHLAARDEARRVIARAAEDAIEHHRNSAPPGSEGHSEATESTGSASPDAAVRLTNSNLSG